MFPEKGLDSRSLQGIAQRWKWHEHSHSPPRKVRSWRCAGMLHRPHTSFSSGRHARDVVRVRAHAVTDNFGQDLGFAGTRVLQLLQDQDAGPFSHHEAIAVFIERAAGMFGSALRVERARMAAKPPTPMGVMAASAPPAIITSASSRSMVRKASPTECALVVQAVDVASSDPRAVADADLAGRKVHNCPRNEKRRNFARAAMQHGAVFPLNHVESADAGADVHAHPLSFSGPSSVRNAPAPPWVAASAKWIKRPILRASFLSTKSSGLKFFTSAAKVTGKPVVSKIVMGAIPLFPVQQVLPDFGRGISYSRISSPIPVTTTRFLPNHLLPFAFFSMYSVASFTVLIFSASSSGLKVKGFLKLHHQFTTSSESAPRSS